MNSCTSATPPSESLMIPSLSPESRAANELVLGWMREAGMQAQLDAIGNVAGRYEGERAGLPCLTCGTPIRRTVIGGRGTHYCPTCQH